MDKWHKCPQCGKDVLYITNPCPNCKLRLDWRQQPPIPYMPPTVAPQQQAGQQSLETSQQPVYRQPIYQAPMQTPQQQFINAASLNSSGQGEGMEIPEEIRNKWNWGAFLLNWIWGIGNSVWIAFLVFIPLVGIVMIFVLGAKGNKWAWQKMKWDSIEHFQKTQRNWAVWGLVITILSIFLQILSAAMGATK